MRQLVPLIKKCIPEVKITETAHGLNLKYRRKFSTPILYINNVPDNISAAGLERRFQKYGPCKVLELKRDDIKRNSGPKNGQGMRVTKRGFIHFTCLKNGLKNAEEAR